MFKHKEKFQLNFFLLSINSVVLVLKRLKPKLFSKVYIAIMNTSIHFGHHQQSLDAFRNQ